MRRTFCAAALLAGALLTAGCDNDIDNGSTPTEPAPRVTDTFTGTINANGAATHTFTVAADGRVEATLTEVAPDATVPVGLGLGTWNGSNCFVPVVKDDALKGVVVPADVSGPGTLCVRIYDAASRVTEPLTYTVTVVHP